MQARSIPIDSNHNWRAVIESDSIDRGLYQILIGKLKYLSQTRSNIAFAVSVVSQFIHSPRKIHMEVVLKML